MWKERAALAKQIKKSKGSIGKELFKTFRNEHLTEREVRVLLHNAGIKTFPRPKRIPKEWKVSITKKSGGMKYIKNEHNLVRIMPGDKTSKIPSRKKPYVKQMKNGKYLDKNGMPVPKDSLEAHIPLNEYKFH